MNLLENHSVGIYLLGALLIAITAFVYSYILTQNGEVFGKLFGILNEFFKTDKRTEQGKDTHPIFKMIMWCEKCVAGQMSTWIFLCFSWSYYSEGIFIVIIPHLLFVGLTIFLTLIVKRFYLTYIEQ